MPTRSVSWSIALLFLLLIPSCKTLYLDDQGGGGTGGASDLIRVRWLRIFGSGDETSPPILRLPGSDAETGGVGNESLTLTMDVQSEGIPNLLLEVVHCNQAWEPTGSIFVRDPMSLSSGEFTIEQAPLGARYYDYTMSIEFPGPRTGITIEYSGNYLARIVDYYDQSRVYAEGRFFVVEPLAGVSFYGATGFYESAQTQVSQTGLQIQVEASVPMNLFTAQVRGIDLYEDSDWYHPISARVSVPPARAPGQPWGAWLSGFGTKMTATFDNIPAGNEHRLLNLGDLGLYPPGGSVVTTPLSDLPRQGDFDYYDRNGVALTGFVPSVDADYVYFEFRLDIKGRKVQEDLAVVGTFSNWKILPEWRMYYDEKTGFYTARGWIKRGLHEYQYIAGTWDIDKGVMIDPESTLLEGNTSYSSHQFWAFVYYRDNAAGGYDRIVGIGSGR